MNHNPEDRLFAPEIALSRVLRGWWLIVVVALAGAGLGMALWRVTPPRYVSTFEILSTVDFTTSGELTQFEEDLAMEAVGALLVSPAIFDQVSAQTGIPLSTLRSAVRAERRIGTWKVSLTQPDGQSAEALAEAWRGVAVAALQQARAHALSADGLVRRVHSLESCLSQAALALPSQVLCAPLDGEALKVEIVVASQVAAEERARSSGISSALIFGEMPARVEPAKLNSSGQGVYLLGGGLSGFLLGVWLALSAALERVFRAKRG